jgi:hypothetical protein
MLGAEAFVVLAHKRWDIENKALLRNRRPRRFYLELPHSLY